MTDITNNQRKPVERVNPFSPIVTPDGCLYCLHQATDHSGPAYGVRLEGRKYRKNVVYAIFCHACAAEKFTKQVACWQMPEGVYRNFSRYGVQTAGV